jgi:hypothetical protein
MVILLSRVIVDASIDLAVTPSAHNAPMFILALALPSCLLSKSRAPIGIQSLRSSRMRENYVQGYSHL